MVLVWLSQHLLPGWPAPLPSRSVCKVDSWWRHQMETFSALLAISAGNSPVTSEFPTQRPVTRRFDVFFDLRVNKRSSKHSWGQRRNRAHYDVIVMVFKERNTYTHGNVIKWKYFPHYWPLVRGIHRSPVDSPREGQWCFLWSAPELTVEQTIETQVVCDAIALIMTTL